MMPDICVACLLEKWEWNGHWHKQNMKTGVILIKVNKRYKWMKSREFYEQGSTRREFIQLLFTNSLSYELLGQEEK